MNGDKINLPELAKYGVVGICLLQIVLIAYMFYMVCEMQRNTITLMENHFQHNTAALERLEGSVNQSTAVSKELKDYLIRKNGN